MYLNSSAATINFSLARVQLLIEGGSYSRTDLIILELYLPLSSKKIAMWKTFFRTGLRITKIWSKIKQPCCLRTKPRTTSAMLLPRSNDRGHTHLIVFVHACGFFHRAPGAATIRGVASIRINTIKYYALVIKTSWLNYHSPKCINYCKLLACVKHASLASSPGPFEGRRVVHAVYMCQIYGEFLWVLFIAFASYS